MGNIILFREYHRDILFQYDSLTPLTLFYKKTAFVLLPFSWLELIS